MYNVKESSSKSQVEAERAHWLSRRSVSHTVHRRLNYNIVYFSRAQSPIGPDVSLVYLLLDFSGNTSMMCSRIFGTFIVRVKSAQREICSTTEHNILQDNTQFNLLTPPFNLTLSSILPHPHHTSDDEQQAERERERTTMMMMISCRVENRLTSLRLNSKYFYFHALAQDGGGVCTFDSSLQSCGNFYIEFN